jgi:hypothetical protein
LADELVMHRQVVSGSLLFASLIACASSQPLTNQCRASAIANDLVVSLRRLPAVEFEVPPPCERREVGVVCRRSGYSLHFARGASKAAAVPAWLGILKAIADQYPEVEFHVRGFSSTAEDTPELHVAAARAQTLTGMLRDAGVPEKQLVADAPQSQSPTRVPHLKDDIDVSWRADVSIVGDVTVTRLPASAR